MTEGNLRIFLFDLDDTIYDRTPHRFAIALRRTSDNPIIAHLTPGALGKSIETIRNLSPLFQQLGYPRTRDRTDSTLFLAGIVLLFSPLTELASRWTINQSASREARRLVKRYQTVLGPGRPRTWKEYAIRQVMMRRCIPATASELLRETIDGLRADDQIIALSRKAIDIAPWEARTGFAELWSRLSDEGIKCYVASEGEEELQREKLGRLGLERLLGSTLLTSERAGFPLDTVALDQYTDGVFLDIANGRGSWPAAFDSGGELKPEVEQRIAREFSPTVIPLVIGRWILDTFATKSPGYYARVLQAIIAAPTNPVVSLDVLARVRTAARNLAPVRVGILGNYHAKDVVPIQQLLGPSGVWTGLLDEGGHRGIRSGDASYVPSRTFPDWNRARNALESGLPWDRIVPLNQLQPSIDQETLGLLNDARHDSGFQVIGKLAEFLAP